MCPRLTVDNKIVNVYLPNHTSEYLVLRRSEYYYILAVSGIVRVSGTCTTTY
jgi:hypothetical protein